MKDLRLPFTHPLEPMEASTSEELPEGDGWQFEPKWDGFRCLVFRDGSDVRLQSKSLKPLGRYFPEVVEEVRSLRPRRFVLDAELAVPIEGSLSFDHLLQRIHPAESRVQRLAAETPAALFVFDLLATGEKTSLLARPLEARRRRLEGWADRYLEPATRIQLSPATRRRETAREWLTRLAGVDGVMAKQLDAGYRSGERDAMIKIKRYRSADCVVGGFRYASSGGRVGSLLLGLHDDEGLLHHVGHTSAFSAERAAEMTPALEALEEPPGFTGRSPGGPSRWSRDGESREWHPLRSELVVEVSYDHFSGGRFRHGARLLRARPDKAPRQCTLEQVVRRGDDALRLVDPAWA